MLVSPVIFSLIQIIFFQALCAAHPVTLSSSPPLAPLPWSRRRVGDLHRRSGRRGRGGAVCPPPPLSAVGARVGFEKRIFPSWERWDHSRGPRLGIRSPLTPSPRSQVVHSRGCFQRGTGCLDSRTGSGRSRFIVPNGRPVHPRSRSRGSRSVDNVGVFGVGDRVTGINFLGNRFLRVRSVFNSRVIGITKKSGNN